MPGAMEPRIGLTTVMNCEYFHDVLRSSFLDCFRMPIRFKVLHAIVFTGERINSCNLKGGAYK
jgi:hypothetical protein